MTIDNQEFNIIYQALVRTIGGYGDMEKALEELTKILWGTDKLIEMMIRVLDKPEHADSHRAAIKQFIKDAQSFFAKGLSREDFYKQCRKVYLETIINEED